MPYVNIEALVPDVPDQGLMYKKGDLGLPDLVYTDHNGTVLHKTIWNQFTQAGFETDLEIATKRFAIYQKSEQNPTDPVAQANATLLDLRIERREVPLEELEKAAAEPGVDPDLAKHFLWWKNRKPIQDLVDTYNTGGRAEERKCCEGMLKLFEQGKMMTLPKDKLFISYWRMAFDGAINREDRALATKIVDAFEKHAGEKRTFKIIAKTMRTDIELIGADSDDESGD